MFKVIILLFGLLVGFGVGVYWAHHNPEAAAAVSAEQERRFLEAQLAITQKIQAKLEELSAGSGGEKPPGGSGFFSAQQAQGASAQDVKELRAQSEAQEAMLRQRIEELK